MYQMYHPKADIHTLYVKWKEGGEGLLQTEVTFKAELIYIVEYLNTKYKEDQLVNIKSHESNQMWIQQLKQQQKMGE